jgi:hypothetical protein
MQELGTHVDPIPRDIDKKLYAFDPALHAGEEDDGEESQFAVAPNS